MKLTEKQKHALMILQKYPNDIVMSDGWLTGGHGVRLDLRTFNSLKEKGLIERWGEKRDRISEAGKAINCNILPPPPEQQPDNSAGD